MVLSRVFRVVPLLAIGLAAAPAAHAQSLNFDFGNNGTGPPPSYAAAGLPGTWNSLAAAHGSQTTGIVDLAGSPTAVAVTQIGGLALLEEGDLAVTGDHALLLDDFLVTYSASLESCIFLDGLLPGLYEVLIYARMPSPAVLSYTSVDQEAGTPHHSVGGAWSGGHQELVSYSRHFATVGAGGDLDLHSGIVPGANAALGAALNGLQLIHLSLVFADGFESGSTSAWTMTVP